MIVRCSICSAQAELPVYKNRSSAENDAVNLLKSGLGSGYVCPSHTWDERKDASCDHENLSLKSQGVTIMFYKAGKSWFCYGIGKMDSSAQGQVKAPATEKPATEKPATEKPATEKPAEKVVSQPQRPVDLPNDTDLDVPFKVRTVLHTLSRTVTLSPADPTDILLNILIMKISPSDPADDRIVDMLLNAGKIVRKIRTVSRADRWIWVPDQTTGLWISGGSETVDTETVDTGKPAEKPAEK